MMSATCPLHAPFLLTCGGGRRGELLQVLLTGESPPTAPLRFAGHPHYCCCYYFSSAPLLLLLLFVCPEVLRPTSAPRRRRRRPPPPVSFLRPSLGSFVFLSSFHILPAFLCAFLSSFLSSSMTCRVLSFNGRGVSRWFCAPPPFPPPLLGLVAALVVLERCCWSESPGPRLLFPVLPAMPHCMRPVDRPVLRVLSGRETIVFRSARATGGLRVVCLQRACEGWSGSPLKACGDWFRFFRLCSTCPQLQVL